MYLILILVQSFFKQKGFSVSSLFMYAFVDRVCCAENSPPVSDCENFIILKVFLEDTK